jgi:hypothetical protein
MIKVNDLITDVDICTGHFIIKVDVEFNDYREGEIIYILDHMGYSVFRRLEDIRFEFRADLNINPHLLHDGLFKSYSLEALAPAFPNNYYSYIDNFGKAIRKRNDDFYYQLLEDVSNAVIDKYGEETIKKAFSLDTEIQTLCEIAEDLDRDTDKERFVYRFCDEFSESKFPYTCALTLSLDDGLDNVYKIEVKHDVDGVPGTGYVKVAGIEALKQTLYAISNGTCLVCAEEFSEQPITCLELYSKTVDLYNSLQRNKTTE